MKFLFIRSLRQTKGFSFINWETLVARISKPPQTTVLTANQVKLNSNAITATDASNRQLEEIIRHNRFTLLRLDLDNCEFDLPQISQLLTSLGVRSYIIHSTASHRLQKGAYRYRIYIQLAHCLTLVEWRLIQAYLAFIFQADNCSNRPQQIMFLPLLFAGIEYEYRIGQGEPFCIYDSNLFKLAQDYSEQQIHPQRSNSQEQTPRALEYHQPRLIGGQVSIIEAVNLGYNWSCLLESYGYKKQGRAWLPPESTSKVAGAYILRGRDGQERYYSHNTSDPCATGHCLDKFAFLSIREFNGSYSVAIKTLAKQFPAIDQHNRAVFIQQSYRRYQQMMGRTL